MKNHAFDTKYAVNKSLLSFMQLSLLGVILESSLETLLTLRLSKNSLVRFSMVRDETTSSPAWLLCGRKRLALLAKKLVRSTCSKSILPLSNHKCSSRRSPKVKAKQLMHSSLYGSISSIYSNQQSNNFDMFQVFPKKDLKEQRRKVVQARQPINHLNFCYTRLYRTIFFVRVGTYVWSLFFLFSHSTNHLP